MLVELLLQRLEPIDKQRFETLWHLPLLVAVFGPKKDKINYILGLVDAHA